MFIQNSFTGRVNGSCHLIISNGTVLTKEGQSEKSDLVINSPFDVRMDIVTGRADGTEMIMQGKYQIEGNTDLVFDFPKFLGKKK